MPRPLLVVLALCACTGEDTGSNPDTDTEDGTEACDTVWYADADGDGAGDAGTTTVACDAPDDSWVADDSDCNDSEASVHPGAPELCNDRDDDCDEAVDEDLPAVWADADADGYGDPDAPLDGCALGDGRVDNDDDCDDTNADLNPDTVWYFDQDLDGYGVDDITETGCLAPGLDYAPVDGDCRPNNSSAYPGAPEVCDDGVNPDNNDDNCNSLIDEGCRGVYDCEPIEEDTTWSGEVVVGCDVIVAGPSDPVLTLADGTVVRFSLNHRFEVGSYDAGRLVVEGDSAGVLLTSDATEVSAGDWVGLSIGAPGSVLTGLTIEGAGSEAEGGAALRIEADATLVDVTVRDSARVGLALDAGFTTADGLTVENSAAEGIHCGVGADADLAGVSLSGNDVAMQADLDCAGALRGPVLASDNEVNAIVVSGLTLSQTDTWDATGLPYRLTQGANAAGSEATVAWTVGPGVQIEVGADQRVAIGAAGDGVLYAEGTAEAPVQFRSAAASPSAGDWTGLTFQDSASHSVLEHVQVAHAGGSEVFDAAIYISGAGSTVSVSHLLVEQSAADCVQVWSGELALRDSELRTCLGAGLSVEPFGKLTAPVESLFVHDNAQAMRFGQADAIGALSANNTVQDNTDDRVRITDLGLEQGGVWPDLGVPYLVQTALTIAGDDGPLLELDGVTVEMNPGAQLQVGMTASLTGGLVATDSVFRAANSNSTPGSWLGIAGRGPLTFTDNLVQGAGGSPTAAIELYAGPATVTGNTLTDVDTIGIRCWTGASPLTVSDNEVDPRATAQTGCSN